MNSQNRSGSQQKIMIIAGEASGDLHGARLVQAMQAQDPGLLFCGMGSREMTAAGVEILFDAARIAVVGLAEVFTHFPDIIRALKILKKRMREDPPDLLILIDFPDFNLMLAKKAKKLGIPVFYYISPQVWAWRTGRVKTIGRLVDTIGVILPFEEPFYRSRGVTAHYVGHPLLDSVKVSSDRDTFCQRYNINPEHKLIGLLPGSRKKEISALLPDFLAAAKRLLRKYDHEFVFLLPVASTVSEEELWNNGLGDYSELINFRLIREDRYDMMAACDAVVAASGTVTLELAILGIPMVVVYRVSPHTYFIGRLLVRHMQFFSLVNLIAERGVVTELLQDDVQPGKIEAELARLLFDDKAGSEMRLGLAEIRSKLGNPGASRQAATLAFKLLGRNK
ncbi:MAG: lipid-A-disaccharide synthase [Proteobacteria bacterium]|jgi:lipid-A-disaccharide synthase|nr:lipid-A-disaccharide synthase [Desulfocapsa sp.]MBU3946050.1 lipid-A-disaccharide synthase [Pseudomonadota bacterium]MCG2743375.1 lipid-A-disaccharide synthase [Desulfobacteraceae bacterium]MBU4028741.1 lipid-A-disaccharide synthase [Pseudomonadota bacterium]MBU4044219.1 lipid-A-disaccharide synthase [Pseudomonadota bacterium]